jgi:hypothetical protein
MMANMTILMVSPAVFTGCRSVQGMYKSKVKDEFIKQPPVTEEILTEKDIEHLPFPVRKYIEYSGAIGKAKPQNLRIAFEAKMISKPGAAPMNARSEQYNFFGSYTRLFLMNICCACCKSL